MERVAASEDNGFGFEDDLSDQGIVRGERVVEREGSRVFGSVRWHLAGDGSNLLEEESDGDVLVDLHRFGVVPLCFAL